MRAQLDDLQRQLSTGQKVDSYAGLGLDRGVTVSLNSQLSAIGGYNDTINTVITRIGLAQTALGGMAALGGTVKSAMAAVAASAPTAAAPRRRSRPRSPRSTAARPAQHPGRRPLSVLRPRHRPAGGRNHRSHPQRRRRARRPQAAHRRAQPGRSRRQRPRPADGRRAGNDLAAPTRTPRLRLQARRSVSSTLTNATVSGPTGSPASLSVDLSGGKPECRRYADACGSICPTAPAQNLTLTATSSSPPGANQFTIGATPAPTAANLQDCADQRRSASSPAPR